MIDSVRRVGFIALTIVALASIIPAAAHAQSLSALRWRTIGPTRIAPRGNSIAAPMPRRGQEGRLTRVIYVGGPFGIYKTTDSGERWQPLFDSQAVLAVSHVAVAPSKPDDVWAATGDWIMSDMGRDVRGKGVYKSVDGGLHWKCVGFENVDFVGRIVIDPNDENTVYVGVLGPRSRPSADRGVYKTIDGGKTWRRSLSSGPWAGIIDMAIDPRQPGTIYAAAWQNAEKDGMMFDHGPGSAIYRTTDGGASWTKLAHGLPHGDLGRIALTISPADSSRVYALIDEGDTKKKHTQARHRRFPTFDRNAWLYRSDDRGDSWRSMQVIAGNDPEYNYGLWAAPGNPDRIYTIAGSVESDDGGRTIHKRDWNDCGKVLVKPLCGPGDNHDFWVDPADPDHLVVTCDDGTYQSLDRGKTWSLLNLRTGGLFYSVNTDDHRPFYDVFGAVQDFGGVLGPSQSRNALGLKDADWQVIATREFGRIAVRHNEPDTLYGFSQLHGVARYDERTHFAAAISPLAILQGADASSPQQSLIASAHPGYALYLGTKRLFKSTDGGQSWEALTSDLAQPLPASLRVMGSSLAPPAFGKYLSCINAIAESPSHAGVLYVGTTLGRIYVSKNGGRQWNRIPLPSGAPPGAIVSKIVVSRRSPSTAFVALSGSNNGDYTPYVFRTGDYGKSWTPIAGGLPSHASVRSLAEDPRHPGLLFAGTDDGVFVSFNGGFRWQSLRNNMPAVRVYDLVVQPQNGDLVAATWGRGIYILDDITPLEQLAAAASAPKDVYIFTPRDTVQFAHIDEHEQHTSSPYQYTENPPYGVPITYDIAAAAWSRTGKLEILDQYESVTASLPLDRHAGIHRTVWDLAYHPPQPSLRDISIPVMPGLYTVRAHIGGAGAFEQHVVVLADPDAKLSTSDYTERYATLRKTLTLQLHLTAMRDKALILRKRLGVFMKQAAKQPKSAAHSGAATSLEHQARILQSRLSAVAEALDPPTSEENLLAGGPLAALQNVRDYILAAPNPLTAAEKDATRRAEAQIAEQSRRLDVIIRESQKLLPKR